MKARQAFDDDHHLFLFKRAAITCITHQDLTDSSQHLLIELRRKPVMDISNLLARLKQ